MLFYKFNGAGNDFVVIDIRQYKPGQPNLDSQRIAHICHRRFGVGADGVMTLADAQAPYDFEMKYYNSDGRLGSMCGNGGRCITAFAWLLGLGHKDQTSGFQTFDFIAFDGPHHSQLISWDNDSNSGIVRLGMRDVHCSGIKSCLQGWFLDTGSPHYVQFVSHLSDYDVFTQGRALRNNLSLFPEGTNVDFVEVMPDGRLFVRTFERGVEDETWACGTGVTAASLVTRIHDIVTRGGDFTVQFNKTHDTFSDISLTGPVALNFTGMVNGD